MRVSCTRVLISLCSERVVLLLLLVVCQPPVYSGLRSAVCVDVKPRGARV